MARAVGIDLGREPHRLWDVAEALPRWGVTAWLPTIVTAPLSTRRRALTALREGPSSGIRPRAAPLGVDAQLDRLGRIRRRRADDHRHAPLV